MGVLATRSSVSRFADARALVPTRGREPIDLARSMSDVRVFKARRVLSPRRHVLHVSSSLCVWGGLRVRAAVAFALADRHSSRSTDLARLPPGYACEMAELGAFGSVRLLILTRV